MIIASPLQRAIKTAEIVFDYMKGKDIPWIINPSCREPVTGSDDIGQLRDVLSTLRSLNHSTYSNGFTDGSLWDWSLVPPDKFWWYVPKEIQGTEPDGIEKHRDRFKRIRWKEPIKVCSIFAIILNSWKVAVARVREFERWLSCLPYKRVAVVAHGDFIEALAGVDRLGKTYECLAQDNYVLGNCEKFVLSLDPLVPKDTSYLPDGGESTFEVRREDLEDSIDLLQRYENYGKKITKNGDEAKTEECEGEEEDEEKVGETTQKNPNSPRSLPPRVDATAQSLREISSKQTGKNTNPEANSSPKTAKHFNISKPGKISRKSGGSAPQGQVDIDATSILEGVEEEGKKKKVKGELREIWEQKKEVWKAEKKELGFEKKFEKVEKKGLTNWPSWGEKERKLGGVGKWVSAKEAKEAKEWGTGREPISPVKTDGWKEGGVVVGEACLKEVKEGISALSKMSDRDLKSLLESVPSDIVIFLRSLSDDVYVIRSPL